MADLMEVTKEIVKTIIATNHLEKPYVDPNSPNYPEEYNKKYLIEVSKAIQTIHHAVHEAYTGK